MYTVRAKADGQSAGYSFMTWKFCLVERYIQIDIFDTSNETTRKLQGKNTIVNQFHSLYIQNEYLFLYIEACIYAQCVIFIC